MIKLENFADKDHVAIWDNRGAFHIGLLDYEGLGERFGYRVVSIGEKPYLDSESTSRQVALGLDNANWRLDWSVAHEQDVDSQSWLPQIHICMRLSWISSWLRDMATSNS